MSRGVVCVTDIGLSAIFLLKFCKSARPLWQTCLPAETHWDWVLHLQPRCPASPGWQGYQTRPRCDSLIPTSGHGRGVTIARVRALAPEGTPSGHCHPKEP